MCEIQEPDAAGRGGEIRGERQPCRPQCDLWTAWKTPDNKHERRDQPRDPDQHASFLPKSVRMEILSLLAVVLLASDVARRTILGMLNPGAFLLRHHPVGLGLVLHVVDVFLLVIQTSGLAFI